jgi:hypothetical protein
MGNELKFSRVREINADPEINNRAKFRKNKTRPMLY